jgi:hypothetical protein
MYREQEVVGVFIAFSCAASEYALDIGHHGHVIDPFF